MSWSPFVGMFIARISRGRTIREFLLGVLFAPAGFSFIWFTVFGDVALWLDLHQAGGAISRTVAENMPIALFTVFDYLPWSVLLSWRSEEHTSELQSLMRISYAVFCLKNKTEDKYQ